jgi:hypothetical protein
VRSEASEKSAQVDPRRWDERRKLFHELKPDIKREADELLRHPKIVDIIQTWLSDTIVGEEHNRLALSLMFLSRKLLVHFQR